VICRGRALDVQAPSVHYGRTPEPVTPYQKAAQIWDERIGSARVQAQKLAVDGIRSLFLSGGLAASLVGSPPRYHHAWVVEVRSLA